MAETNAILQIVLRVRDEAAQALSRMGSELQDLGGNFDFAFGKADAFASALSAIGAGAILSKAIDAFADAEVKMRQFDAIIQTLSPNLQALRGEILRIADEALIKFGFDNEDAALSMARFAQSLHDSTLVFPAFQAAMDLARAKNMSLEDATRLVITALSGNVKLLKEYGIEVDEHASKAHILAGIQDALRGQAEAYSETLKGQLEILKKVGGELFEVLGGVFAPLLGEVIDAVLRWIEKQGGLNAALEKFKPLITIIGGLLVGVLAASFAVVTAAILTKLLAFGLLLGWMGAIGTAVILLAVLWKYYWDDIKTFFIKVWESIRDFFTNAWNSMKQTFDNVIDSIKQKLQSVLDTYNRIKDTVSKPFEIAGGAIKSAGQSIGNILPFASGGIVTRPTLGLLAESGAEAVIPLDRFGGIGSPIVINLNGDFYTDTETAERWGNEIARILKNQLNLAIRA